MTISQVSSGTIVPENFALSADGLVLAANGLDPVLAWDGMAASMWPLGLPPPDTAPTLAASGTGTILGTYYGYLRYMDSRGEFSDLSPLSAALAITGSTGKSTITYSAVEIPASPRAVRRQLLRNTAGQTKVFYIDVDTADLTSTTFTSTRADSELSAQTAVSLLDSQGRILANLHGVPPSWKLALAAHRDRLFLTGEVPYDLGSVSLTGGSTTVSGVLTSWPASLAGRYLYVAGSSQGYLITSVNTTAQTLTLSTAYAGATDPYADYSIRASPGERRLLYFTEAGLPGSWPPTNAVSVQEDGDDIIGLMPRGSFLYILCRRHTYKLTFQAGPDTDGYMYLSQGRGCANNRSWVVVDQTAYLLDEAGVWSFDGSGAAGDLSPLIQDLFDPSRASRSGLAIRWQAARWFHACHDPGRQLIRWFVTMSGSSVPRHALVLGLKRGSWWVEEYPVPIGGSCLAPLDGERRVFLGGPGGRVYLLGPGRLDLADPAAGPVWGPCASSGPCSVVGATGPFAPGVVGAPLVIVAGRGSGQLRRVVAVSGTTLTLESPWLVRPDETSIFQLGGVRYQYRTGWFRWLAGEDSNARSLEVQFEPTTAPGGLDFRLYEDRAPDASVWSGTLSAHDAGGFASTDGQPDLTADLTTPGGFAQRRFDSRKERYVEGPRLAAWEARGATNQEGLEIYQITLEGVEPRGGRPDGIP